MKKLAVLIVCAAVMASCDSFSGGSKDQLKAENDSLLMELTQRNAELDEMMGTFNDISEGFRQINAAESRVAVSYTHLDVYKRQWHRRVRSP